MRIIWRIEDGYVGPDRPHHLEIPDEFLEHLDDDEKQTYIDNKVEEEFHYRCELIWEEA